MFETTSCSPFAVRAGIVGRGLKPPTSNGYMYVMWLKQ